MPIHIASVKFNNEFRTGQNLGYLISCIGEKVKATYEVYYEDLLITSAGNGFTLIPSAAGSGTLTDLQELIGINDTNWWNRLAVGDSIEINGTVSNDGVYVITELPLPRIIRIGGHTFTTETFFSTAYLANVTPFNGFRYAYNLIASGANYNSLIDGEFQEGSMGTLDATNTTFQTVPFNGIESYQIGDIKVKGVSFLNGRQSFIIEHNFVVTPFFLASQYAALLTGTKPSYFDAQACLNYISSIQLGRSLTDPTGLKTLAISPPSNTGWFNENFNAGVNKYSITSVQLTRLSDSAIIPQLEFEAVQIDITINNPTAPFSSGNTKFIFGFNYLPEDADLYQDNGFDQKRNFLFDSKINTLGSAPVNGDNFGNGMQAIKTVGSTFISTTQMKVTAIVECGVDALAILQQGDFSRYMFWVITENHALTPQNSDKVNLLAQVNEFYVQLTTTDLIDAELKLIQHPFTTRTDGVTSGLQAFPVDDIAANTYFNIDFTGHTTEGIKINKIKSRIVLKKIGEADILLEDHAIVTLNYPVIGGLAQNISYSQDRPFKVPAEIRRTITATRDYAADTSLVKYYEYNYPFMHRWEYWVVLQNALSNIPSGIFDPAEPLNGLNNFWHRYTTVSGWGIYYETIFEILQNGELFEQTFSTQYFSNDFGSNPDWINESLKSYDTITPFTEMTNGVDEFLTAYRDVKVVASFEKLGALPALADVGIVIWIETYEQGGENDARRISSYYVFDSTTWFKSTDNSNKVVVQKTGSVYTGECFVDFTKIPIGTDFEIYARIYDATAKPGKLFQDGSKFLFQNGDGYIFQDQ